jgi:predicted nucleotide-binding protein
MSNALKKKQVDTAQPDSLLDRFGGDMGIRRIAAVVERSVLAGGNAKLAAQIAAAGNLVRITPGEKLITEGAADSDLYVILSGVVGIDVKGTRVNHRKTGDHIGEIAAADPSQLRSADVVGVESGAALCLSEAVLTTLADEHPEIWRRLFIESNQRLVQRNALVRSANGKPNVFIICSREALETARTLQASLAHDDMIVTLWTDGVFRVSEYPLQSLRTAVDESDFAIAVIHGDDVVRSRRRQSFAPRDNVTFELGLFMGQLGPERSILVEPRGEEIKLASDLRGLTTLTYRTGDPVKIDALLAPTAHELRKHINRVGVR